MDREGKNHVGNYCVEIRPLSGAVSGGRIRRGRRLHQSAQARRRAPAPPVQKAMRAMAWLSLGAIILLWVTGIGLGHMIYGTLALGWAFSMKLAGASILLVAIAMVNMTLSAASRTGQPPSALVMTYAPMASRGALVLVLAGIAITTTG